MNRIELFNLSESIKTVENHAYEALIEKAYANEGEMSTLSEIEFAEVDHIIQKESVVLKFKNLQLTSIFEGESDYMDINEFSIIVYKNEINLAY